MYRPLALGAVLLLLATTLLAEPSEPPTQLSPLEIRIPSITKKWKTPAGSNGPDITIDDIERCMGQDVAQINQLVASYNADVAKLNGQRAALLKEQGAINQTVATHNEAVARSNQLVAQFNERNGGFQGRAGRIAGTSAAFKNNCAGERVLRK